MNFALLLPLLVQQLPPDLHGRELRSPSRLKAPLRSRLRPAEPLPPPSPPHSVLPSSLVSGLVRPRPTPHYSGRHRSDKATKTLDQGEPPDRQPPRPRPTLSIPLGRPCRPSFKSSSRRSRNQLPTLPLYAIGLGVGAAGASVAKWLPPGASARAARLPNPAAGWQSRILLESRGRRLLRSRVWSCTALRACPRSSHAQSWAPT